MEYKIGDTFFVSKEHTLHEDIKGTITAIETKHICFVDKYGNERKADIKILNKAIKMEKKLSREEIYNDLAGVIPEMKQKQKDLTFDVYKKHITNLEELAQVQKIAEIEDRCITNFELLQEIGIDSWNKLDEEYNKIQEGVAKYDNKYHNAIMTIFSFVDLEYNEQSKSIIDYDGIE